ncbi:MAG: PAS domain S-box protein [Reichenbachiella sp.]|uniref:PAS domain-containing sensor histidine kinase n=1 Tax=Reichenbachiella sp. TaxID=2184521 RepID=UPI0029666BF3|nr:PAS domain S-box protein [Reichenbachiella sp.]MDW3210512.1 PAS domain S-box protein [Reichenbachiella sp.]
MTTIRITALTILLAVCAILISVNYYTLKTTSAVRAYINGESQYSKGQKAASNHLILYLTSKEEHYWDQFLSDMNVPIGDSLARIAMQNDLDRQEIKKRLLQGKNHEADIERMIWLFRSFNTVSFMREAISLWSYGDQLIGELYHLGLEYREKLQGEHWSEQDLLNALKQIAQLSSELTHIEEDFSEVLGITARKLDSWLFITNSALIIIVIGLTTRYAMRSIKKLKSANELRNNLANASFEASIWYDKNSVISFWNPQAEKTFGWKADEIIGKKLTETIIPAEYHDKHNIGIENYVKVGIPPLPNPRVETVAQHRNGTIIPIELSILALNEGKEALFCAHIFDRTSLVDQKNIEEKQTSYLRAILESTDDGILATSSKGHILEANQRFCEQWGIDQDYIMSAAFEEVSAFILDQIEDAQNVLLEVRELFQSDEVHTRLIHLKNGKIFERHSVPMILDNTNIGRVWSFRDISDKIKAESDYKNLFENSAEGIYIGLGGGNGSLLTVNPAMAKMYGYGSPAQMLDQVKEPALQFFVDQKDRQAIREQLKAGKTKIEAEYRSYKKNGEIFWVRNHLKFTVDENGAPLRFEGSVEDITARKHTQEQLVQQIEELKKVNFELDRFVYSVSHDLRAPLLSIKGLVNISESENPSPTLMKYLNMIRTSVERLDKFIMDILDYSRNSRLEVQQNEIDFKSLTNEIINNMIHMEGYQHVLFNLKVKLKSKFVSDKRRIEVILANLISNAIKYQDLNKSSQNIDISIIEQKGKNQLAIIVEDNGVGIEHSSQGKIFDMFYRASDRSKGAGLGLYIIKETVEKMNGSIELLSKEGKFTKFTINLPIIDTTKHSG